MAQKARDMMLRENRIIIVLLSILTVIAVGIVLYNIRSMILPFALAVFFAYVLNPLIQFFEDRRVPTFLAILLALVITFIVLNLFGLLVYTSIKSFAVEFPKFEDRFNTILGHITHLLNIPADFFKPKNGTPGKLHWLDSISSLSLQSLVLNTLGSILNFMSNTFLVLLFLLFILIGRNQLTVKVHLAFRPETAMRITAMLNNINKQIQKYLIAKTAISFTTGLLFTIVLLIYNVQFALIWGILAFMLNFIPNIGSVIATILPLSIAFIQFSKFTTIIWIMILLVSIQITIGNFIDPRIVGRRLNLSPLVVLFSLIFWGWLWGILGMFLAVPIMVMLKIVFENIDSLRFIGVMMSSR